MAYGLRAASLFCSLSYGSVLLVVGGDPRVKLGLSFIRYQK